MSVNDWTDLLTTSGAHPSELPGLSAVLDLYGGTQLVEALRSVGDDKPSTALATLRALSRLKDASGTLIRVTDAVVEGCLAFLESGASESVTRAELKHLLGCMLQVESLEQATTIFGVLCCGADRQAIQGMASAFKAAHDSDDNPLTPEGA